MAAEGPRWRRRSAERPAEIADAALAEFATRGYAGARVADIAASAGVSKAALFSYFPTKADLLLAVVARHMVPSVAAATGEVSDEADFGTRLQAFLIGLARLMSEPALRRLARMIIAEADNFPEIARTWHDQVVGPALSAIAAAIATGQAARQVRPGDPRLMAVTVVGPMLTGMLWREVMEPAGGSPVDLEALAAEHLRTVLGGFTP